jgi:NAD(P)-dependent dehydrogenase (short-subunit alcohol dehydrogenase family)
VKKVIVIGATGTIGRAVADALATEHEVVRASRQGDVKVDIEDPRSIAALFRQVKDVDAVVSCAGNARFVPLARLSDDDIAYSLKSKLLGQVELIRQALQHVREGGSVTVTSGVLAQHPMPGGAAISMVNAGLEGFVRGAAAEATRGVRVNAVSPPWVSETLVALKMDPAPGLPAATVARAYVAAVTGRGNGETLDPAAFA